MGTRVGYHKTKFVEKKKKTLRHWGIVLAAFHWSLGAMLGGVWLPTVFPTGTPGLSHTIPFLSLCF